MEESLLEFEGSESRVQAEYLRKREWAIVAIRGEKPNISVWLPAVPERVVRLPAGEGENFIVLIILIFVGIASTDLALITSSLLDEFLLDGAGDGQVNIEDLGDEHVDDFVFVGFEVLLDLGNLCCGLLLQVNFELFVLFLNKPSITLSFNAWNSAYFCCLYLFTSCSAAYFASFSFLCLRRTTLTFPFGRCWWFRSLLVRP